MAMAIHHDKANVKTASWLDVIAGLWLVASPFILQFSDATGAMWNSVIFGTAVVLLAVMRATGDGYKTSWPSWTNTIIGLWLIVSPFALGFSDLTQAMWNSVIMGAVVIVLSIWSALSTPSEEL